MSFFHLIFLTVCRRDYILGTICVENMPGNQCFWLSCTCAGHTHIPHIVKYKLIFSTAGGEYSTRYILYSVHCTKKTYIFNVQ